MKGRRSDVTFLQARARERQARLFLKNGKIECIIKDVMVHVGNLG